MSRHVLSVCITLLSAATLLAAHYASAPIARAQCTTTTDPLDLHHADAYVDEGDAIISGATLEMEVAMPYLNPCTDARGTPVTSDRLVWSGQTLWIFTTHLVYHSELHTYIREPDQIVETGWKRVCDNGCINIFFFACCNGDAGRSSWLINEHVNPPQYYHPVTGGTYQVALEYKQDCDNAKPGDQTGWCVLITGPGLPETGIADVSRTSALTAGEIVEVGGEARDDVHDMGVSGSLDPRYLASGVYKTMWGGNVVLQDESPRYVITTGSHSKNYFQAYSDIHAGNTPTAVATTGVCSPGW
jgi:hypothetical protein